MSVQIVVGLLHHGAFRAIDGDADLHLDRRDLSMFRPAHYEYLEPLPCVSKPAFRVSQHLQKP